MSREILTENLENIKQGKYIWNLYFLKIDNRSTNPYYVYKYTFGKPKALPEYINSLCDYVLKYQIEPLESVQEYNGENSKVSCDKIDLNNELIKGNWEYLTSSLGNAERKKVTGKYQGYILDGHSESDLLPSIVMGKTGNPLIPLNTGSERIYKNTGDNELDDISDEICRLYLKIDFLVIDNTLYSFNNNFERIFNLETTFKRIKSNRVKEIVETDAFDDMEKAKNFFNQYSSQRTFLTFKYERFNKLNSEEGRKEIVSLLDLEFNDGKIVLNNQSQANQLIKYLCFKIFQDKETDNIIEVTSVVNDDVLKNEKP